MSSKSIAQFLSTCKLASTCIVALVLAACASTPKITAHSEIPKNWVDTVIEYESRLSAKDQQQLTSLFEIDDSVVQDVKTRFGHLGPTKKAQELSRWLIGFDGRAMIYDLDANYTPNEAFHKAEANCLSFTLLLVALASELDVELSYNLVDIPNVWASDDGASMVLVRHINAVDLTAEEPRVYDLAMFDYELGYPQKRISKQSALALFFNNVGVDSLQSGELNSAIHNFKLSISRDPSNSDSWNNLGAAFKRLGDIEQAQNAFLYALSINSINGVAASNLERMYRNAGEHDIAERYATVAKRARLKNPYFQFQTAREHFDSGDYHLANKHINRAISLYNADGRFYELRSYIRQAQRYYSGAFIDLKIASKLSVKPDQQKRFQNKVDRMASYLANNQRANRDPLGQSDIKRYRSLTHLRPLGL